MMKRWTWFLTSALLLIAPSVAFAQVAAGVPNQPIFPQSVNRGVQQFLNADSAGTYKTVYTAGAKGSICKAMWMQNSDTATHLVTVQIVNATIKYGGPAPTTSTAAGTLATLGTPQNLMTTAIWPGLPLDQNGNPYFYLISGDTVQATFATTITSTAALNIIAVCADF